MKPFILFAWLCVICSHQSHANFLAAKDFGVYLEPDSIYKQKIVIRSKYFVTTGNAEDKKAAELGVEFWNKLSGHYFLNLLDSAGKPTGIAYPIHFDLQVFECDLPASDWEKNEKKHKHGIPGWDIRNVFFLVRFIASPIKYCYPDDPERSLGLTCKHYYVTVRKDQKENKQVIAHEIGHTFGLEHDNEDGLMQTFCQSGSDVAEYEIRKILEFSYTHKFSEVHTSFDEAIPKGEIRHYTGRSPLRRDRTVVFRKIINPLTD